MSNPNTSITERRRIGNLGEDIACRHLINKGFEIISRNYNRKWGELDVVVRKNLTWHFIEVKTITHETPESRDGAVSQITPEQTRPEDNLHEAKLKRVARTAETYLIEHGLDEVDWQIDALVVRLNIKDRKAKVLIIENVL